MGFSTIPGAVLAGGRSRRMGRDKRSLYLGRETLLERACRKVRTALEWGFVSVDADFPYPTCSGLVAVRDTRHDQGPLGGIYSVLKVVDALGVVFVPLDMPFVPIRLLRWIAHQGPCCDALFIRTDRLHPFPGYYARTLLPRIEQALNRGQRSCHRLLASLEPERVRVLTYPVLARFGLVPWILFNLNTPDDFYRAWTCLCWWPNRDS